ncbi:MAG: hypothetical protein J6T32_02325 [Paludibacteraceae bacterium]|nr:hypothetical protein [Paludibacteraceae bacterium]
MNTLILIAEEGERKLIEQYLPNIQADVLVTGVGAYNIMRSLRDLPLDTDIINIGYAGSANYAIGSVVEVTESRLNHPCVTYPEPVFSLDTLDLPCTNYRAVCYSGTDFVTQSDYRDCVFDMELAFIVGLGFRQVRSLKIVSDNLSLHAYHEFGSGVDAR